jgi:hypothetical protein
MKVVRRGDYGFDSPYVPIGFGVTAIFGLGIAVFCFASSLFWLAGLSLVVAVVFALSAWSFVWTTRRGKVVVWAELLDALALRGDERFSRCRMWPGRRTDTCRGAPPSGLRGGSRSLVDDRPVGQQRTGDAMQCRARGRPRTH